MKDIQLKFKSFVISTLLAGMLAATACQPLQPIERAVENVVEPTPLATEATQAAVATSPTGRYSGLLSVAGMELEIHVDLVESAGSYTGTIDIPAQGALGIPLHNIRIEPPSVHFEMLEGPALAVFEGQVNETGALSGVFKQAGMEGTFTLQPAAKAAALPAGVTGIYTNPAGRFTAPIPTGWTVTEGEGFVRFDQPAETQRNLDFYLEQIDKQVQELAAKVGEQVDAEHVAPYLGRFANPVLGEITLTLVEQELTLDAGDFITRLRPKFDDKGELEGYIQIDPPLQGAIYKFVPVEDGMPTIVLGEGAVEYTFVRSE